MTKSTRNSIIIIATIIIASIVINKCNRKDYHFNKIRYSTYDENNNLINDTTMSQLGEVKSFKDDEGNWSEFGIQNYDGYYVFEYISNPTKTKDDKITFDVRDAKGDYYVVIDENEGTIIISQTESINNRYLFLTVYLD